MFPGKVFISPFWRTVLPGTILLVAIFWDFSTWVYHPMPTSCRMCWETTTNLQWICCTRWVAFLLVFQSFLFTCALWSVNYSVSFCLRIGIHPVLIIHWNSCMFVSFHQCGNYKPLVFHVSSLSPLTLFSYGFPLCILIYFWCPRSPLDSVLFQL